MIAKGLYKIILLIIVLISTAANAQYSDNPISVALDNLKVDFSFSHFEVQSESCTRGTAAITSKITDFVVPHLGFFTEGRRSFSFDLKIDETILEVFDEFDSGVNEFYISTFDRFGQELILFRADQPTNGWRRISLDIPASSTDINLIYTVESANIAGFLLRGKAVQLDNIRPSDQSLSSGNTNVPIEENGCLPEPPPPPGGLMAPIISMVLDEPEAPSIKTIAGTFSLPDGMNIVEDVVYEIVTEPFESFRFEEQNYDSSDQVTIPSGSSFSNYELTLPADAADQQYKISFRCMSGCDDLKVTTSGYWRDSFYKVEGETNARIYTGAESHIVDLQMQDAVIFGGNLSIPANLAAVGGEFISVNVVSLNQADSRFWNVFTTIVTAQTGQNSIPFRIGVPADDPDVAAGWFLYVNCIICDSRYEQNAQYSTNYLTGDPLTTNGADTQLYPVSLSQIIPFNNLTLTLLPSEVQ